MYWFQQEHLFAFNHHTFKEIERLYTLFVEFMICVRLLCQTPLFSKVCNSLLVAKGPTKFGTVRQTAKEYRSTKYLR